MKSEHISDDGRKFMGEGREYESGQKSSNNEET